MQSTHHEQEHERLTRHARALSRASTACRSKTL
jgi:hypothetical protein